MNEAAILCHLTSNEIARASWSQSVSDAIQMDILCADVAKIFGITPSEIKGSSRLRHIYEARHVVMLFARERGMSLQTIARLLNKDHTSVIHGVRLARERVGSAEEIQFKSRRTK